jgi:hypothetical protein
LRRGHDDRIQVACVEQVIQAELYLVRLLSDRHVFRKHARGAVAQRERARTEIQIIVFQPQRPVVPQRIVHAHARGPTIAGAAPSLIERGRDRSGLEVVRARERRAALQIEESGIERVADPTGHRPKPSLSGPTAIDSVRANGFALQVAPRRVAFDPDHPFSDLMIESDLASDHDGVAGFRDRAIAERPMAIGKARADMTADIKPGPVVGRNRRQGLHRHRRIRGLRGIVREQCNGRDPSDGAHERSPVSSPPAAAFLCAGPRTRDGRYSAGAAFLSKFSFFAGKEGSVAIPTQLAWQTAFVPNIPDP